MGGAVIRMNTMPLRSVLLAILCLFVAAVTPAQTDPNAVFATVNGDEIKSGDFWHRLAWYRVDPASPMAHLPAGFLAANQLITERLIYQMARDKQCMPTQEQIQDEISVQLQANPTLISDMKADGRPESDLYDDVKYQLAQYNLRTYGITITDQEVEDHYKRYPSEFTVPEQFQLRVIAVQDDSEQAAVDSELAAGKSFGDVATAHSLDVSKGKGGEFGTVPETDLSQTALKAINSVKIGSVTDWVQGNTQDSIRVKYMVENIIPGAVKPLDAKLRRQIRRKLAMDKGDVKNSVFKDLEAVTITAKVTINQPGFQKIYDNLISSYRLNHHSPQ
jgi:foldase protein PrsA